MLDRLRQNVAVKELLQSAGRPLMRKTASVPNFSHVSTVDSAVMELYFLSQKKITKINEKLVIAIFYLGAETKVLPLYVREECIPLPFRSWHYFVK